MARISDEKIDVLRGCGSFCSDYKMRARATSLSTLLLLGAANLAPLLDQAGARNWLLVLLVLLTVGGLSLFVASRLLGAATSCFPVFRALGFALVAVSAASLVLHARVEGASVWLLTSLLLLVFSLMTFMDACEAARICR